MPFVGFKLLSHHVLNIFVEVSTCQSLYARKKTCRRSFSTRQLECKFFSRFSFFLRRCFFLFFKAYLHVFLPFHTCLIIASTSSIFLAFECEENANICLSELCKKSNLKKYLVRYFLFSRFFFSRSVSLIFLIERVTSNEIERKKKNESEILTLNEAEHIICVEKERTSMFFP